MSAASGEAGPGEAGPRFGEATQTDCDREPIHIPGSIQPHGCLLSLDGEGAVVQHAGDLARILGAPPGDPAGRPLATLAGEAAAMRVLRAAQEAQRRPPPLALLEMGLPAPAGPVDAAIHWSGPRIVVEFEPARRAEGGMGRTLSSVQRMLAALDAAVGIEACLETAAAQVRAVTGFDRVMVYRFLDDGSGEVVAETRDPAMESYLGLRYPESDVPKQARELYRRNWLRAIPDVGYQPIPLTPPLDPMTGAPLDLSFATLRSVSPLHVQYLKNMGVAASMSISILHQGRLWGLIACHHRTPKALSAEQRAACEMFGQVFSLQLESREHALGYERRLRQRAMHAQLVARLSREDALAEGLIRQRPNLLDLIDADGVAVWVDGAHAEMGRAPDRALVERLVGLLEARGLDGVFATDRLAETFPEMTDALPDAAGVLALSVSRSPRDYIFWFRPEIVSTVSWAGDPTKTAPPGEPLRPRASFAVWRETVRGRSRPWRPLEIEAARELRVSVLEVVLRRIDEIARERAAAQERQAQLVSELDHRVKNTLANVEALMRQSRMSSDTLDGYVTALERRVEAMARAQGLLSENRWRGVSVGRLAAATLTRDEDPGLRAETEGPEVSLKPKAALALGLVLHELAANAARFGALSRPEGAVSLRWSLREGTLAIGWRERGGPPVTPPTRRGFGRTLVEASLRYELGGGVELRFEPEGVSCDMTIPRDWINEASAAPTTGKAPGVLIVEDSMIFALDLEMRIEGMGCRVIGPTARVEEALAIIEREPPDLAVLDINLGDRDSFPIADSLSARGVPFLFLTGYDPASVLPARFRETTCLPKPVSDAALQRAIERRLTEARDAAHAGA